MNFTFKSAPCGNGILLEEYVGTKKTASRWLSTEEYKSLRQALNNSISITETNAENSTPKFKVEDWVVTDYGNVSQVVSVDNAGDGYTLDNGAYFSGSWCDMYHPWTIADAKDGDVLAADECYVIFKEIDGLNIKCYCTYHYMGFNPSFHIDTLQNKTAFHPATKEQSDLLFKKMKEAGYQWDADKKELRKIQPHYDITNFHEGMPVLVRDDNGDEWNYLLFSHYRKKLSDHFFAGGSPWFQCVPFDKETKHLLGTTDMPSEEFINW